MSEKAKPKSKRLRVADEAVDGEIVLTRAEEAYQKKLAGWSLAEIAEDMGYSSAHVVARAITERLEFEASFLENSERKTIIALELARLDMQTKALWESAMYGDIRANLALLAISEKRMKWSGADLIDAAAGQQTVLVVGGDETAYLDKLKSMSGPEVKGEGDG